jgi:hypothetical protein
MQQGKNQRVVHALRKEVMSDEDPELGGVSGVFTQFNHLTIRSTDYENITNDRPYAGERREAVDWESTTPSRP